VRSRCLALSRSPALPGHLMGIVETHQALAIRAVHGQRVVEAMGLVGRRRHPVHDEFHPVAGLINHQHLTVQVQ
jgi:hypothetical protein